MKPVPTTSSPPILIRHGALDLACAAAGIRTDAALAKAMGLHPTTVYRTLSGQAQPGAAFIAALLAAFPEHKFEQFFEVETAGRVPA